jgi:carbamoyltransferase
MAMTNDAFARLFDGAPRTPESRITRRDMDLAASIQQVTEMALLRMVRHLHRTTQQRNLCLAGGVALNCVANGRILREGPFERIWIQPAAGDAGGSLGTALAAYHGYCGQPREMTGETDAQGGSLLGPAFSEDEITGFLETYGYPYQRLSQSERAVTVARSIAEGKIVGYFSGRMEFGPRALGARSILGDPRRETTQTVMNLRIKRRESFRPFAPAVLAEHAGDYFDFRGESPYMMLTTPVMPERRLPRGTIPEDGDLLQVISRRRSDIPAVTHWDYSARLQTVTPEAHPEFYRVLRSFYECTGCPALVNTSFNVRGEPIVCTPRDAYRCFMRTELDALYLDGFWLTRAQQPPWRESPESKRVLRERLD